MSGYAVAVTADSWRTRPRKGTFVNPDTITHLRSVQSDVPITEDDTLDVFEILTGALLPR